MTDFIKYKEQRMLDKKESALELIEERVVKLIDSNPFCDNIIVRYDNNYTKEMNSFVIEHFREKGFYVNVYYDAYNDSLRGTSIKQEVGICLSTKEQSGYCNIQ
jgi:hypothetical protein